MTRAREKCMVEGLPYQAKNSKLIYAVDHMLICRQPTIRLTDLCSITCKITSSSILIIEGLNKGLPFQSNNSKLMDITHNLSPCNSNTISNFTCRYLSIISFSRTSSTTPAKTSLKNQKQKCFN